ncbi:MAG: SRPBCC domain-containing protein [Verrucomicrobiota bacterium]|nr:SRPBCC domain-containing protein [Verrucomicrobiota bacterium]
MKIPAATMTTTPPASETADRHFVISRTFALPRERLFELWTDRKHLQHWFGPKGIETMHCTNDLRPGGVMHYAMRTPDENTMWGKWVYREIVAPERLVFVDSFSDESGGIARHPFSAGWPLEMLSTVIFDEREGGTAVTVRWASHNATELERETFNASHDSMREGWTGTFDRLGDYIAKL